MHGLVQGPIARFSNYSACTGLVCICFMDWVGAMMIVGFGWNLIYGTGWMGLGIWTWIWRDMVVGEVEPLLWDE